MDLLPGISRSIPLSTRAPYTFYKSPKVEPIFGSSQGSRWEKQRSGSGSAQKAALRK